MTTIQSRKVRYEFKKAIRTFLESIESTPQRKPKTSKRRRNFKESVDPTKDKEYAIKLKKIAVQYLDDREEQISEMVDFLTPIVTQLEGADKLDEIAAEYENDPEMRDVEILEAMEEILDNAGFPRTKKILAAYSSVYEIDIDTDEPIDVLPTWKR